MRVAAKYHMYLDGSEDDVLRIETDKGVEGVGEVDACPEIVKAIVDAPTSHEYSRELREPLIVRIRST